MTYDGTDCKAEDNAYTDICQGFFWLKYTRIGTNLPAFFSDWNSLDVGCYGFRIVQMADNSAAAINRDPTEILQVKSSMQITFAMNMGLKALYHEIASRKYKEAY
jgi:hypothetical protein